MIIKFLTIFPQLVHSLIDNLSSMKRAKKRTNIEFQVINIRDFAQDKHKQIDDYAYGIGKGMILKFDVLYRTLEEAKKNLKNPYIILPSPRGKIINKKMVKELVCKEELIFICPNYEGVDDRILRFINEEISIGDYVISSGELASFVILEAIIRYKDEKVVNRDNLIDDSFNYMGFDFLLEAMQYTRPPEFTVNGISIKVPSILFSGNHQKIKEFLLAESIEITIHKKPGLFKSFLNKYEKKIDKKILFEAVMNSVIPS